MTLGSKPIREDALANEMKQLSYRLALALSVFLLPSLLRADVGLVLNSSMATGSSFWTSGGHASIYLSRVCPVTAVKVRLCAPGEQGSVLSNYSNFHENRAYEWNVTPVSDFLYGVDDPANRPLYASPGLQNELREHYRATHLAQLCATDDCKTNPDANWNDLIGATFLRTVYIFEIKTTEAQDLALIERLNDGENVNRYNGFSRNCADFARDILNSYFPHAVQSHRYADFYITSPKSTARSLTHFGEHHNELDVRVTRFAQLPGAIRRSDPARSGMETVFTTKKSLLPMLLRPEELAFIAGSYLLTDRFSAERAARRHAHDPELEALQTQAQTVASGRNWAGYAQALEKQEDEARELGVISGDKDLASTFGQMERAGVASVDQEDRPWIALPIDEDGQARPTTVELGLASFREAGSPASAALAYRLQLARVRFYLHSRGMDREAMPEFQQDWALLQGARDSFLKSRMGEPLTAPVVVTAGNAAGVATLGGVRNNEVGVVRVNETRGQ